MSRVKKSRKKRVIISLVSVFTFIGILVGSFFIYVSIYNHATDNAVNYLSDSTPSEVKDNDDYVTFEPKSKLNPLKNVGFIFYPGGKVDYKAYAPLLRDLSDNGVTCILVKMPFNLAVFNVNGADKKQSLYSNISTWYIGGHSLGGAMACSYLAEHHDSYRGLILMGSYSTVDLSGYTNLSTLSLLAENDKVINKEKYESNKKYLPDLTEYTIKGGIHSYFGDYGIQSGDGNPTITCEDQRNEIRTTIVTNIVANAAKDLLNK